jgi:hypothetical protein
MEGNGWKETANIASIRNSKERTNSARVSHSSRESADDTPHNTRSVDLRGEITCFPRLKALIGVVNGMKRRRRKRKTWGQVDPSKSVRNRILQTWQFLPINTRWRLFPAAENSLQGTAQNWQFFSYQSGTGQGKRHTNRTTTRNKIIYIS